MSETKYKNYTITFNEKSIPDRRFDYDYVSADYDGENGLSGSCGSVGECISEINQREQAGVKTIYYNDDPWFSLEELKAVLPAHWELPEPGFFLDEDGCSNSLPPFGKEIVIKNLSEILPEFTEDSQ